jgi:hypothetical protein
VEDVHGEEGRTTMMLSHLPQSRIFCFIFVSKNIFAFQS